MNNVKRLEILERLRSENPNPQTELEWSTPFELLIAVLLSAQATDVSVNKATRKLYPVANTPQSILDLGVDGLKTYIKTIGLFNTKAENVIKTCRMLIDLHGGEIPEDQEAQDDPSMQWVDLPVGEQYRYSVGASTSWDGITMDMFYEYADLGSVDMDRLNVNGTFDGRIHFVGVNFTF